MTAALPATSAWLPRPTTILEVTRETRDVFTWALEAPPGFTFAPGQFDMLYAHGVGEVPISISGDPATAADRVVHTIRSVGTVTSAMARMTAGDVVGMRGPYGRGWPLASARGRDVVFVAGGLGLAPLRPAILQVLAHRDDHAGVLVLYGARTPEDMIFRAELERWRGRFDCTVEAIVDRADRSWRGSVGVVTRLIQEARFDPERATAFLCGPEIMMRHGARALAQRGVPPEHLHLSMERSMKCGVGLCGHCQWGPAMVCRDGPVHPWSEAERLLGIREI
jgi:NAD(P)H-flavin reductase